MAIDLLRAITQEQFAALVGISQPVVSDLVAREILARDGNGHAWLLAYCANLRAQAAGRADSQLTTQRARLADAQRQRIELDIATKKRQLAPVVVLEVALANVARQVATILEALPIKLRRRSDKLSAEDLQLIEDEITRARNVAASAQLNLDAIAHLGSHFEPSLVERPALAGDSTALPSPP